MPELVDQALRIRRVDETTLDLVETPPLDASGRFTLGAFLGMTVDQAHDFEEDYLDDVKSMPKDLASEAAFYELSAGKDLNALFDMWAWANTKDYGAIKIAAGFAQRDTIDLMCQAGRRDEPLLLQILKARQLGQTTAIKIAWYLLASMMENKKFLTMAHKQEKTLGIARMQTEMHRLMPFRPRVNFALSKRYAKWVKTGSELQIESAEDSDPGHSSSYNFIHMSEYSLYQNALEVDGGFGATAPTRGFYVWIKECRGNGMGHPFYASWCAADRGESKWKNRFHSWWQHPAYEVRTPLDAEKYSIAHLTEDERAMVSYCQSRGHVLRPGQIEWYRQELATTYNGDVDQMWQNYPTWPMQAFLSSGRPVFDPHGFERLLEAQRSVDALFTGDILEVA